MGQSVAIVTLLTEGTRQAVSVIQALEALAGPGVTRLWILGVNVAIALARSALPFGLLWVAIVTRGTLFTTEPLGTNKKEDN